MNIAQINRLDITIEEDLQLFVDAVNRQSFTQMGPSGFSDYLVESIFSDNEQQMFKAWILITTKISLYMNEATTALTTVNPIKRMHSYLEVVKTILIESSINHLKFHENLRYWHNLIFSSLSEQTKTILYGVNNYIFEKLNSKEVIIPSFEKFLEQENKKTQLKVAGYKIFMKTITR